MKTHERRRPVHITIQYAVGGRTLPSVVFPWAMVCMQGVYDAHAFGPGALLPSPDQARRAGQRHRAIRWTAWPSQEQFQLFIRKNHYNILFKRVARIRPQFHPSIFRTAIPEQLVASLCALHISHYRLPHGPLLRLLGHRLSKPFSCRYLVQVHHVQHIEAAAWTYWHISLSDT